MLVLALILIGGVVLYNLNPVEYRFMPKCIFKMITGYSCPGCGIQRAIYALMHGEVVKAIQYNYYLLYSGPYALSFLLVWLMPEEKICKKIKGIIENKYVVDFYVITFVIWLVIRNILDI